MRDQEREDIESALVASNRELYNKDNLNFSARDRGLIETMLAHQFDVDDIRKAICPGVKLPLFKEIFKHEIASAPILSKALMSKNIFNLAMKGNVPLMIHWSKTQMGWKETNVNEVNVQALPPVRFNLKFED